MDRTRLVVVAAFLLGAVLALVIEHVGLQSPGRTIAFLGVAAAIGYFGRLTFEAPRP